MTLWFVLLSYTLSSVLLFSPYRSPFHLQSSSLILQYLYFILSYFILFFKWFILWLFMHLLFKNILQLTTKWVFFLTNCGCLFDGNIEHLLRFSRKVNGFIHSCNPSLKDLVITLLELQLTNYCLTSVTKIYFLTVSEFKFWQSFGRVHFFEVCYACGYTQHFPVHVGIPSHIELIPQINDLILTQFYLWKSYLHRQSHSEVLEVRTEL